MSDLEYQAKIEMLKTLNAEVAEIYRAVEEFLNNFGKENVLYPTRMYVQVETQELQKLARVFYNQKS